MLGRIHYRDGASPLFFSDKTRPDFTQATKNFFAAQRRGEGPTPHICHSVSYDTIKQVLLFALAYAVKSGNGLAIHQIVCDLCATLGWTPEVVSAYNNFTKIEVYDGDEQTLAVINELLSQMNSCVSNLRLPANNNFWNSSIQQNYDPREWCYVGTDGTGFYVLSDQNEVEVNMEVDTYFNHYLQRGKYWMKDYIGTICQKGIYFLNPSDAYKIFMLAELNRKYSLHINMSFGSCITEDPSLMHVVIFSSDNNYSLPDSSACYTDNYYLFSQKSKQWVKE